MCMFFCSLVQHIVEYCIEALYEEHLMTINNLKIIRVKVVLLICEILRKNFFNCLMIILK